MNDLFKYKIDKEIDLDSNKYIYDLLRSMRKIDISIA
jgi:hypothetical protein